MPESLSKRLKRLQETVQEQEATILHLRNENSVLTAKLAAKRRRKPVTKLEASHERALLASEKSSKSHG